MTREGQKTTRNIALKLAIFEDGRTQRELARLTGIGEVRLSAIVRGHGAPASAAEKSALAKALKRSIETLFPATATDAADATEATA